MSLRKIMQPKPKPKSESESPRALQAAKPEPEQNGDGQPIEQRDPRVGSPAMILDDKFTGLQQLATKLATAKGGEGGFSINQLLTMDDHSKGLPEILGYPIGAQEKDKYRMFERSRLSQYQIELFSDGAEMAEHGLGFRGNFPDDPDWDAIGLDWVLPNFGDWIVYKLRAYVSKDGESLGVFERTVSGWKDALYKAAEEQRRQVNRGINQ